MSYIDTFDHEFVGYFGGIPVYHPLATKAATPDSPDEFGCTPEHLVVGGGLGENLAIVVKDPGYAVAQFLSRWLIWCEDNEPEGYAEHKDVFSRWDSILLNEVPVRPWAEILDFAGWHLADYARFAEHCSSAAFLTPFTPGQEGSGSIEEWLAASLGEFVFFAMPELGLRTMSLLDRPHDYVRRSIYRNVVLPPPGYPDYYGRRSSGGVVIWGHLAWRISRSSPT